MRIVIETIFHGHQRYPTAGDWLIDKRTGDITIFVSQTGYDLSNMLVIAHELAEVFWCLRNGITQEQVDDWDIRHPDEDDPGSNPMAPYHLGHMLGDLVERTLAFALRADWEFHEETLENLDVRYGRPQTTIRSHLSDPLLSTRQNPHTNSRLSGPARLHGAEPANHGEGPPDGIREPHLLQRSYPEQGYPGREDNQAPAVSRQTTPQNQKEAHPCDPRVPRYSDEFSAEDLSASQNEASEASQELYSDTGKPENYQDYGRRPSTVDEGRLSQSENVREDPQRDEGKV